MIELKDENELIIPAREGALRLLRAAKNAGVRRVVLTSSFAAVGYGRKSGDQVADGAPTGRPVARLNQTIADCVSSRASSRCP